MYGVYGSDSYTTRRFTPGSIRSQKHRIAYLQHLSTSPVMFSNPQTEEPPRRGCREFRDPDLYRKRSMPDGLYRTVLDIERVVSMTRHIPTKGRVIGYGIIRGWKMGCIW